MIRSNVAGISDRAFNNAVKARLRDPTRPIRLLDFLTYHERAVLYYDTFGYEGYQNWLNGAVQYV